MMALLQVLHFILPVAYAAVFALYVREFSREGEEEAATPRRALWATLGIHASFFVLRGVELGFVPLASKADFLSLVTLGIATVYATIEHTQKRGRTGAFFIAPALVGQSISAVLMDYSKKHEVLLENPVFGVHVIFLVLGLTALAVGALYALMYVLMIRQLKARDLGVFFKRLPPLATLERMSKLGTVAGVVLLGLGVATGAVLGATIEGFDMWDPKIIVSIVIWLGYLAGLGVTRVRGLSGLQAAWITMVWFAIFLVSIGVANHSFA